MWLFQLALIVVVCHCCGWLAERAGQCRVVGEIAAGIVLGPTVFGALFPQFFDQVFGAAASSGMPQLGEVGVVLLMFQIGLHLDLGQGGTGGSIRAPLVVALGGMVLPFAAGLAAAEASRDILAPHVPALQYLLFGGVALSVSAVPVMARIIDDLKLTRHPAAQLGMAAAMLTDVAGWSALSVIASLSVAGSSQRVLLEVVSGLALYVLVSVLVARFLLRPWAACAARAGSGARTIAVVVPCVLLSAWATSRLGFHSAFGSLFAGILLRRVPGLAEQWSAYFDGLVRIVLLPVFFAYGGLHVKLNGLDGTIYWIWFAVFFLIAFAGKFGGSYLGARLCGVPHRDAAIVGSLMNTRGLMELIVLSIGLQMHILPQNVYSILVFVALVTTAMTVPFIRWLGRSDARIARYVPMTERAGA